MKPLYTIKEISEFFGVSKWYLYNRLKTVQCDKVEIDGIMIKAITFREGLEILLPEFNKIEFSIYQSNMNHKGKVYESNMNYLE